MALSSLSKAPSPSSGEEKASKVQLSPQQALHYHKSSSLLEKNASTHGPFSQFDGPNDTLEIQLAGKLVSHSLTAEKSKQVNSVAHSTLLFPRKPNQGPEKLSSTSVDSELPESQTGVHFSSSMKTGAFCLDLDTLLPDTQVGTVDTSQIPNCNEIRSDSQMPVTQGMTPNSLALEKGSLFRLNPDVLLPDTQIDLRNIAVSSKVIEARKQSAPTSDPSVIYSSSKDDLSVLLSPKSDSLLPDTQRSYTSSQSEDASVEVSKDLHLPDTQRDASNSDLQAQQHSHHHESQVAAQSDTVSASIKQHIIITNEHSNIRNDEPSSISPSPSQFIPTSELSVCKDHSHSQLEDPSVFINTSSSALSINSPPVKPPANNLTVKERKRIVVSSDRCPALTTAMRLWIRNIHRMLDPFREDDNCWLHPSPPRGHLSVRGILHPCGKLQKRFIWQDRNGRHSLVLNYGIVSKLVYRKMTKQQIDGFINKHWHLSHLCGNWTCVNPAHTTVEPGNINISRNNCFSHRSGCLHNPPCMKEKKVPLGPDGKLINHNASVASYEVRADQTDDWSVMSFDNGEGSLVMDEDDDDDAFERDSEDEADVSGGAVDEDSFADPFPS